MLLVSYIYCFMFDLSCLIFHVSCFMCYVLCVVFYISCTHLSRWVFGELLQVCVEGAGVPVKVLVRTELLGIDENTNDLVVKQKEKGNYKPYV